MRRTKGGAVSSTFKHSSRNRSCRSSYRSSWHPLGQQQRGIALIIVLWVITLLSLIAASFVVVMRSDVRLVTNSMGRAKAEAAANAGVQRAMFELFKPINTPERWAADGVSRDWNYQDAAVTITMNDEAGKIDINTASEPLLRGLLQSQGMTPDDAVAMVDAMADWRDTDSLKRLHGAEEAEYVAAGLKYKPANAPFQATEELKLVLGMTPPLYDRIAPLITIYSRQPGVYSQIASRAVLRAIPNVTEEQIDAYIQLREQARQAKAAIPIFTAGAAYLSIGSGYITRIRAEAKLPDGANFIREAVGRQLGNPKRFYAFLQWKEGREQAASNEVASAAPPSGTASAPVPTKTTPLVAPLTSLSSTPQTAKQGTPAGTKVK